MARKAEGPYAIWILRRFTGDEPAWALITRCRCLLESVQIARAVRGHAAVFLGQVKLWPITAENARTDGSMGHAVQLPLLQSGRRTRGKALRGPS